MHGADQWVPGGQFVDAGLEVIADGQRVLLQPVPFENIEHGQADHTGHRTAAGRGEEVALGSVGVGDRPGGDHRAQRLPVTHRFGDADDIGDHILLFEGPEPTARAAIAHLNLIGDGEPADSPDRGVDRFEVAVRQCHPAGIAVEGLADEGCRWFSLCRKLFDDRDRLGRIFRCFEAAVQAAKCIGGGHGVHPVRSGRKGVGVVGDRGGDRIGGVCPTVIRLGDRDDVVAAGGRHGQPQCQIVGFGAGVDQEHRVQWIRQGGRQSLGQGHHGAVVEPGIGVQSAPLPVNRVGQFRMPVAEDRNVVDHVEIGAAVGGDEMLAPAPFDTRGMPVVVLLDRCEGPGPPLSEQHTVVSGRISGSQSQQHRRITDPVQPARRVVGPDEIGNLRLHRVAAALDPHWTIDGAQRGSGRHRLRVADLEAHRSADLNDAGGPGQCQCSSIRLDGHHAGPRGRQRQVPSGPQVHTGRDGGGCGLAQRDRAGQPRLPESGDHRDCTTGERCGGQSVFRIGHKPRAAIHRIGVRREIQPQDSCRVQSVDQRCAGDRFDGVLHSENMPDLGGHHIHRHGGRAFEDSPLVIEILTGICVLGVNGGLVHTADHQHGSADDHHGPQCFHLGWAQWAHRVERLDSRQHRGRLPTLMAQHGSQRHREFGHRP